MKTELKQLFHDVYGDVSDLRYFFSPGRVNLIGEHTDYNGGHVFPCTLSLGTYGVIKRREDQRIRCFSGNYPEIGIIEVNKNHLEYKASDAWVNYLKGVLIQLQNRACTISSGFDIVIKGNIPGGGLSSSASLELLLCVMLDELFQLNLDRLEMVKLSQQVENEYIGVSCGIMDQFIIGMGKKNQAILLDTHSLNYKYVPLNLGDYVLLIGNTNKERTLADSKYNERFQECQSALKQFKEQLSISSLGDMDQETFEKYKTILNSDILRKRSKHAVYENQRTLKSYNALRNGDLKTFGQYMIKSHESLRDDYDVSCRELDVMVDLLLEHESVLGARMTGAGFGGCTVSMVLKSKVEEVIRSVGIAYEQIIGYAGDFHEVEIGQGAGEMTI